MLIAGPKNITDHHETKSNSFYCFFFLFLLDEKNWLMAKCVDQVLLPNEKPKVKTLDSWGIQLPVSGRPDGRPSNFILRPLFCKIQPLFNAHGSAQFQMGFTSVLAAVYGPREGYSIDSRGVTPQASLTVLFRPASSKISAMHKYIEVCLYNTLKSIIELKKCLYCMITVVIQPEVDDGGLLSCSINAAVAALIHAQIPLKYTVISLSIIQSRNVQDGSSLVLDPTFDEAVLHTNNLSTYLSCTINTDTLSLIQLTPDFLDTKASVNSSLFSSTPCDSDLTCSYPKSSFLDVYAPVIQACSIVKKTLRRAFEEYLITNVATTFSSNNQMNLPSIVQQD
jgi:ribonuclease PH